MTSQPDKSMNPERHFFLNYSAIALNGSKLEPTVVDKEGQLFVKDFPKGVMAKLNPWPPRSEENKLNFILRRCGKLHENLLRCGFNRCTDTLLYAISIVQKHKPYVLCARDTYDRCNYYLIPILRHFYLVPPKGNTDSKKSPIRSFRKRLYWQLKRRPQLIVPQVLIFCPQDFVNFLFDRVSLLCEGSSMTVAAMYAARDRVPCNTDIIIADPNDFDPEKSIFDLSCTTYCVFDYCDVFFRRNNQNKLTQIWNHLSPKCHRSMILGFLSKESVQFINSEIENYAALLCGEFPSMSMFTRHTVYNCENDLKPALAATLVNRYCGAQILIYVNDPAVIAVLANELRDLVDSDQPQCFSRINRVFIILDSMGPSVCKATLSNFLSTPDGVHITSDIASENLQFPDIPILINYDLPKDIETFVSRYSCIGRTPVLPPYYSFPEKSDESLKLMHALLMQVWKQKEGFNKLSAESFSLFTLHDLNISCDLVALLNELQEEVPPFLEVASKDARNCTSSDRSNHKEPKAEKFLPEFFHSELSLDLAPFSNFQSTQHLPVSKGNTL